MDAARVPWAWRDYCAHLLIPLNKCRRQEAYLPWACHHEKHVYEKCQYKVLHLLQPVLHSKWQR